MFRALSSILEIVRYLYAVIIFESRESFGYHFVGHCPILRHRAQVILLHLPTGRAEQGLVSWALVFKQDFDAVEVELVLALEQANDRTRQTWVGVMSTLLVQQVVADEAGLVIMAGGGDKLTVGHDKLVKEAVG